MSRNRDDSFALTRKPAKRQPNKRVHVLCEGGVTEPRYLESFIRSLSGRTVVPGIIRGHVGVPKTIVEMCIELKGQISREARKSGYKGLDEVWAVFDVDEHDLTEALPLAKANSIRCAISNPCIEIWGLFHEKEEARPFHRHDAQKALSLVMPGYHHEKNPVFSWEWCQERIKTAAHNSARARMNREKEGSVFPKDVPSTNFERLLIAFDPSLEEHSAQATWSEWPVGK